MRYIKSLPQYEDDAASAVTFGKFDGLHMGHQKLIGMVRQLGKEKKINSILCGFDMRPLWESRGIARSQLMAGDERYRRMDGKIDYLVECPFDEEFCRMEAEDFIRDVVYGRFHAKYVVVGKDFHFGRDRGGDVRTLRQHEKQYGYQLIAIEKERYGGHIISSTYIREVLGQGNVPLANTLLGYRFQVSGCVSGGRRLGRRLGFPTVNLAWPEGKFVPPYGVYVTETVFGGRHYPSISNIGVKPTVSADGPVAVESYLLGFAGELYGENVGVELLEFRRPEKKFGSVGEMKAAVELDIAYAKEFFS